MRKAKIFRELLKDAEPIHGSAFLYELFIERSNIERSIRHVLLRG